jgi:hypothetical protein
MSKIYKQRRLQPREVIITSVLRSSLLIDVHMRYIVYTHLRFLLTYSYGHPTTRKTIYCNTYYLFLVWVNKYSQYKNELLFLILTDLINRYK